MKTEEIIMVVIIAVGLFSLIGGFGGVMGGYGFGSGGMWLFGWLFMTLIITALVLGIIWLTKQIQKK